MQTTELTINLDDILIGDRLRKDYGDLTDLDSIADRGLIQPIVLNRHEDGSHSLVAGGRRLTKLRELGFTSVTHGVTCDPQTPGFVYATDLAPDVRREIELYENIGRKSMDWKERATSIAEIHQLKSKRAALDRESWGLRESGAELGMHYSSVQHMVMIAEELKNPDSTIHKCENATAAVRWFFDRRADEAKRKLAELSVRSTPSTTSAPVVEINHTPIAGAPPLVIPLSNMLFNGRMEDILPKLNRTYDRIITDWPYGINMANLSQTNTGILNIDRVESEHDAKDNVANFEPWLYIMWLSLKDGGHCVIWCDVMHWSLMHDLAINIGFRVQRWPLHWIKTSPCLNQMANKNFTKAVEHAMVLSKGNAFLVKPQSTNYWSGPRETTTSNPFAKPKGLWLWIMSAICAKGEEVLDPFAGEGSSTLAAIEFGLRPTAIESQETHYNQLLVNIRSKYDELTKGNVVFE